MLAVVATSAGVAGLLAATSIDSAAQLRRSGDVPGRSNAAFELPGDLAPRATPPAAPRAYRLPRPAIWVSNGTQLRRALARNASRNIILRSGVYDSAEPFHNARGDRLYSQTPGGAVLRAGLTLGGNTGPGGAVVRGVAFDVQDESKTLSHAIITVWGSGKFSSILDVTLEGHGAVGAAILARQVEGLVIQRVVARHFRSYGVIVDPNDRDMQVSRSPLLEDIDAAYVSWSPPMSSNGTAEACLWVGVTAVVRRVRAHDCASEGVWVGSGATGALFEDIRVRDDGIGLYLEHFVRSSTFRRLQIGPNVTRGLTCEWADPAWGSQPACVDNLIELSSFDTGTVGVYLDAGTTRTTVRDSAFTNQCWAAIGNYQGNGNLYDTSGNDYSGLRVGAVPIASNHLYASDAKCAQPAQG